VRVDSGVEQGGEITPFYDPMIAKLIALAPGRVEAASRLAAACREVEIWPVRSNAAFLARALDHPDFVAGDIDTGFIGARETALVPRTGPPADVLRSAAERLVQATAGPSAADPWTALRGFRVNRAPEGTVRLRRGGEELAVTLPDGAVSPLGSIVLDDEIVVFKDGGAFEFSTLDHGETAATAGGDGSIRAPMPGRIVAVSVTIGDQVTAGAPLVALEAMKMEHTLKAPFDGNIKSVAVQVGQQVTEGTLLVEVDPEQ
jgi:acetyl/propionyl-CoA carboxylase alpha subunit